MQNTLLGVIVAIGLIILFLPFVLAIIASIKISVKVGKSGSILIVLGVLLITLTFMNTPISLYISSSLGAEALAEYAIASQVICASMRYLSIVFISVGLIIYSKRLSDIA
jgi:hypothetical protein